MKSGVGSRFVNRTFSAYWMVCLVGLGLVASSALAHKVQIQTAEAEIKAPRYSAEKAESTFRSAIQMGLAGKNKEAAKLLQSLLDTDQTRYDDNLILMTAGRLFYQAGAYDKAIEYYQKVDRTSDFWLEAIEEKAYSYARLHEYEKTLSQLETLMVPLLAPQIGPEPYFLQALVDLKMCNYKGVFSAIEKFKKNIKPRADELTKLAKNSKSPLTEAFVNKLKEKDLTLENLGRDANWLPRLGHRDHELILASRSGKKEQAFKRLSQLAEKDLEEIGQILRKMQVVEIEAIQRMHGAKPLARAQFKNLRVSKDQLKFPAGDEVWLDELDHYHVNSNQCETQGG